MNKTLRAYRRKSARDALANKSKIVAATCVMIHPPIPIHFLESLYSKKQKTAVSAKHIHISGDDRIKFSVGYIVDFPSRFSLRKEKRNVILKNNVQKKTHCDSLLRCLGMIFIFLGEGLRPPLRIVYLPSAFRTSSATRLVRSLAPSSVRCQGESQKQLSSRIQFSYSEMDSITPRERIAFSYAAIWLA